MMCKSPDVPLEDKLLMRTSQLKTVASLGWVSAGAATEGVTPIF